VSARARWRGRWRPGRERDRALQTLSAIALHLDTIGVRQPDGSIPTAGQEAAAARHAALTTLHALGYDEFARRCLPDTRHPGFRWLHR
jgi:hypothetical protein